MDDKYGIEVYVKLVADQAISGAKALAKGLKNTLGGDNPMEKAFKTSKRLALSLFGVTTIWRGIIKSVNTYLSVNTELQARLNGMYYALGSLFAPVLEWILNILGTWVLYIDAFARGLGLAGIQMNSLNKQAKKTSHSLAGFDEINNLTEKSSGGGGSIKSPFAGLSLGDFGEKFYLAGEWCKKNLPVITGLIVGLGTAFLILKADYGSFKDSFGLTLIITGVIGTIQSLITFLHDPTWEHFADILGAIAFIFAGLAFTLTGTPALISGIVSVALLAASLIIKNWDRVKTFFANLIKNIKEGWDSGIENISKKFTEWKTGIEKKLKELVLWFGLNVYNPIAQKLNGLLGILNNIFGKTWRLNYVTIVDTAIRATTKGLASYDVGTSYVPNDQLAMIHQGEAVIPKKFNSSEYFNNGETNELLQTLIERVDAIELSPYVTVTDVGKASVKYINQQTRIKGGSVL